MLPSHFSWSLNTSITYFIDNFASVKYISTIDVKYVHRFTRTVKDNYRFQ